MKISIFTTFLIASAFIAFAQNDSIIYKNNFICFKPSKGNHFDTLNRVDEKGLRQGNWIEYDSTKSQICKYNIHGDDNTRGNSTVKSKDPCGPFFWTYFIKWSGNYFDNKKVGIWKSTYKEERSRIELIYVDGVLQMPIIQYTSGRILWKLTYDFTKGEYRHAKFDQLGNESSSVFYFKTLELFLSMTGIELKLR